MRSAGSQVDGIDTARYHGLAVGHSALGAATLEALASGKHEGFRATNREEVESKTTGATARSGDSRPWGFPKSTALRPTQHLVHRQRLM